MFNRRPEEHSHCPTKIAAKIVFLFAEISMEILSIHQKTLWRESELRVSDYSQPESSNPRRQDGDSLNATSAFVNLQSTQEQKTTHKG